MDLLMARLRFGDETAAGVKRLHAARARWERRKEAITLQVSVRAANALWVVGVWSRDELRRALHRTPNLLRYVRNCGSTTEQELVQWSSAECVEEPCPHCHGKGVILRPSRAR